MARAIGVILHPVHCVWCGAEAERGTRCPRSIPCPRCKAKPGHPCKRPSGHRAAALHMARVHEAERECPAFPSEHAFL